MADDRGRSKSGKSPGPAKKKWVKPKVTFLGRVNDVVQVGRGKLSIPSGDPGEPTRKPSGTDR